MSKVAFYTLGCKLNFAETSTIGQQFLKRGYDIVDYNGKADVYVINTCTVTDNADRECRQIVRRALRNNPEGYVIVTGCYAQLRSDEISKIDGVDAVLGSKEKFNLFSYLDSFEKKELFPTRLASQSERARLDPISQNGRSEREGQACIHVSPTEELDNFSPSFSTDADSRTRAFFKIQDGCDYKCSFCTIPLARGKSRSADPDEVVSEFKQLLQAGYKEIILTGVNVGDYNSTLEGGLDNDLAHNLNLAQDGEQEFTRRFYSGQGQEIDLFGLLKLMLEVEGDYRIRISSIEPNLLTDEIIKLTADDKRMCNHFHIPLQSGSANVLRLMQRRYKVEDYRNLILKAVDTIDDLGIGVDVIVGFPGETEEDFLETYNFLKELPISYLHVFTYSERPNTKAINMDGHVDVAERKRRNNMLRILSEKKRHEFYQKMIDKELTVLFEHENHEGFMRGFSSNYVRINHSYNPELINKFVKVKVTEVDEHICTAENLLQ